MSLPSSTPSLEYVVLPSLGHPSSWGSLIVLPIVTLLFFGLWTVYSVYFGPLSQVPGPKWAAATRLFELYHINIKNDWYETLIALHEEYGPVVRIGPNEIHFSDHEFCLSHHKQSHLKKCSTYYGALSHIMGGLADPSHHSQRKSIIQPLFGGQRLAQFSGQALNSSLGKLFDRLKTDADGSEVNLTYPLWAFTTAVMFEYVFGKDSKFVDVDDLKELHDKTRAFSAIDLVTVLRSMAPVKWMFDAFPGLRSMSPLGWLDNAVKDQLRSVKNGVSGQKDMGVLPSLWNHLQDERITVHETSQAIFIGNESLLSNMTALLHELMKHPECIKTLRAELDTLDIGTYGHEVWRDPKVMYLPYLDALCRESTRLSAPGWHRQPRQLDETIVYKDLVFPPMTSLSFTVRLHERDPKLWPEADEFRPNRWLGPNGRVARQNSVTFGTGTRTCLGQHIARHVMRKTLVCLLYNFDIQLWDEVKDTKEGFTYLNTYPQRGTEGYLKVKLLPRFRASNKQTEGMF